MTKNGNKKKYIRSFMVVFISFCMVMSTAQVTHAGSVKLSELPAGAVITIGGHSWNVLDPVKGYLQSYHHVGEPTKFDPDNTKIYNPSDGNNIAYYLNNTFYNSLTEEGKAMILNHTWSTGDQYNENASSVTCKVGVISRSEFDTYKPFMSHAVTAYFWSRTPFSGIPISVYVVNPGMVDNEKKEVKNLSYMVPTVYISPDTVITNTMINHTITASMNKIAWGSVSFNGKFEIGQTVKETFAEGASVTVTAQPLPGYKVASWTVNGGLVSSTSNTYTFTNGSTDTSVVANFGTITYPVNVNCSSEQGSVSGSGQYTVNQTVTLRATPNPGYLFDRWRGDGISSQNNPHIFPLQRAGYNIWGSFKPNPNAKNVNLSCDPADGGSANGGGIKTAGSSIKVTAVPNEGYRFVGWEQSGSIVSTSTAYTFTVPSADISLTAKFELIPFKITTSNPIAGERNKAYSYSFTAVGGMGTKTYAVTDGTLPAGLTLSTEGKLSGTPTDIGNSTFTVGVSESGTLARSDSKEYTMTINEESLAINKTNSSNGSVGAAYSHSFTATGGTGAKTYAVTAGTLPEGLTLAADGTLSGTPTTIETSNFTITVADSASTPVNDSNAYSITIAPETLAINKANPASVIVGATYSHNFTATGGTGEKTYAVTAGTLPAGLSLAADGTLSGTPTAIETSTFTVTATDSATPAVSDSNAYTIIINPASLIINTSNPASGTVGTVYNHSFTATGGTGAKSFSVTAGNLPAGLSLAADGTLSGTPSAIETSIFTVTVTDSATPAVSASNIYTMIINPKNSGGNFHSGGGGGFSSSDKPKTSTTTKDTTNLGKSSLFVTSTMTTQAKTDLNGKAETIVTENQISDTIAKAIAEAGKDGKDTLAKVEVKVTAPSDAKSIETSIPKSSMKEIANSKTDSLTVSTPIATVTFDDKSLDAISKEADTDIKIKASKGDITSLSPEIKQVVGDRLVFSLNVTSGEKTISKFTGNVTISIPYTPKNNEDKNAIVIYDINADGKPEIVSNGTYNSVTEMITFKTNHFSQYAVGYNKVKFTDVDENAWYGKAVSFVAARGITTGTEKNQYSPNEKLTRAQLMVMVMRAYDIKPDVNITDNFADAKNTYYTGYLAAAKRIGISQGVGANKFEPEKEITRQEMFTLMYKILKEMKELLVNKAGKDLTLYNDKVEIAPWAKDAVTRLMESGIITGSNGKIMPADTTSRAEMTQVLYRLMNQ